MAESKKGILKSAKADVLPKDQSIFMRAATIAKITVKGKTDQEVYEAFQRKYGLEETGVNDKATAEKMASVAVSRGSRRSPMKRYGVDQTSIIPRNLSLNMSGDDVKNLQKNLSYFGYAIDYGEFKNGLFGGTTIKAIQQYQKDNKLTQSGRFDRETRRHMNDLLNKQRPRTSLKQDYTVRGSVHNKNWEAETNCKVTVTLLDGEGMAYKTTTNKKGFYNIKFPAPKKRPFSIQVEISPELSNEEKMLLAIFGQNPVPKSGKKVLECNSTTTWVNFTGQTADDGDGIVYDGIYKGPSEYEVLMRKVYRQIGEEEFLDSIKNGCIREPKRKKDPQEMRFSKANAISLTDESIKRLQIAQAVSDAIPSYCEEYVSAKLDPDVVYGLIRANLFNVNTIEGKELPSTNIIESMFFETTEKIKAAYDESIDKNYITRRNQLKGKVWISITSVEKAVELKKKALSHNISLSDLLNCTVIKSKSVWPEISAAYKEYNRSLGALFFNRLRQIKGVTGDQVTDFERTCQIASVVLNNTKVISSTKGQLGSSYIGTLAKWDDNTWTKLGVESKDLVTVKKIIADTYTDELFISQLYMLNKTDEVLKKLYDDYMFRTSDRLVLSDFDSVNKFNYPVKSIKGMETEAAVCEVRRLYLLTFYNSITFDYKDDYMKAASVLWKDSLRSAVSIRHKYTQENFVKYMSANTVSEKVAKDIYSRVEEQYLRIITYYYDYRAARENSAMSERGKQANLKNLFGSQDAYEYDKSMSLLGQSAYYVDLLRFLKKMPSVKAGKSAYDVLIAKRPDLEHIKLDGQNSETLVPYIDLTCEIVEREIKRWQDKNIDYTPYNTVSPSEELMAKPANVSHAVYKRINNANYPITRPHFSLYQREIRALLEAVGLKRYKIMELYGAPELNVAGEFLGFSSMELSDFCQSVNMDEKQILKLWNRTSLGNEMEVRYFMQMTGLSYEQTVEACELFGFSLSSADFTGKGYPDVDSQRILVKRIVDYAEVARFIQVWRHTSWSMRKLYDFVKAVSDSTLDGNTIIHLYRTICPDAPNREGVKSVLTSLMVAKGIDPNNYIHSTQSVKSDTLSKEKAEEALPAALLDKLSKVGSYITEKEISDELFSCLQQRFGKNWTTRMAEIYNPVREAKRDALVAYATEYTQRAKGVNTPSWKDATDMYNGLLIDVQMNSAMNTSRIKQATNSVQLFVQRCLLNLESDVRVNTAMLNDTSSLNSWGQWSWMKNYRVWEANRKIFLFPENWIEPELRDNQTPFFKEFMDTVDQMDPTTDNYADALLDYLYKVEEVSHLEVCNIYRQKDNISNLDILHVIARTKSSPAVYYYRTCDMNSERWSAWEKVEVDVAGDQMTLAMYRGKLHLFWLAFTEKVMKPSALPEESDNSVGSREAIKYYEIQLAWTYRKNGAWMSKTVSKKKLIHPWERPTYSYDLKSFMDKSGRLHLDVYLSTSPEFNNAKVSGGSPNPEFTCRYSRAPYSETFLPWHSSTFLFEGHVSEVFMKDVGVFGCMSVEFINKYLGEDGRDIKRLPKSMTGPALLLPHGMHLKNNRLVNNTDSDSLYVGEELARGAFQSRNLLTKAGSNFEMLISQQTTQMNAMLKDATMFFQDKNRAYVVMNKGNRYKFKSFYHPFSSQYISTLNQKGIDGLLQRKNQTLKWNNSFENLYKPNSNNVTSDFPMEIVDFSLDSAYGVYNWELFFHIPLTVACRLSENMKYEDAMKWFHYIFNPLDYVERDTPQCYWVTEPFHKNSMKGTGRYRIESILKEISKNADLLSSWKNNPFKPHIIAQYRTEVYQKLVVKKYVENLVSWADSLFRQDTWESINEAIMLYLMAAEILGERPEKVKDVYRDSIASATFKDLSDDLDIFGNKETKVNVAVNTLLAMENMADIKGFKPNLTPNEPSQIPTLDVFYFNVPSNDALVGYWNTIEDRMFKIRNSMNIDGVVRTLSLNAPEIDPAALVRAAALGMSINSEVLAASENRPKYRFKTYLQKAVELCGDVRAMGDKLLAAIEKEDAAEMSQIRADYEVKTLEAVTNNKKLEIESIKNSIGNLEISLAKAEIVQEFYENIEHISAKEAKVLQESMSQLENLPTINSLNSAASIATLIPSIMVGVHGVFGSPVADSEIFSGRALASSLNFAAGLISSKNAISQQKSSILSTKASYERRSNEWRFQASTAKKEVESIQKQIEGQNIRLAIAEQDLENHMGQIENSKAIYNLIKNQFTNKDLYTFLKKETSGIYKKLYELAFSYASKAEKCYNFEIDNEGAKEKSFISKEWTAAKAGLMSGEHLLLQLRQMEEAYLENDKRCYELTKRISLSELPASNETGSAFMELIKKGSCEVSLPEWLYDMDYPNHGNRRIKNVSITIPCIVGPNTNVNCTLTILGHFKRTKANLKDQATINDLSASEQVSIATSTANNDSGMFEINFNGDRYLPFEGYGAVSKWRIDLPLETNFIDRTSISDVIINITYYAQECGTHDKGEKTLVRIISARHDFPENWHRCSQQGGDLLLSLEPKLFPSYMRKLNVDSREVKVLGQTRTGSDVSYEDVSDKLKMEGKRITVVNASQMMGEKFDDFVFVIPCK